MASILKVNTIQDATNSNTAISVDSSGRVTVPQQIAFAVSATNAGGNLGIQGSIVFDKVHLNKGSHYDSSNGRFTAPVAGLYIFHFNCFVAGNTSGAQLGNGSNFQAQILKNATTGSDTSRAYNLVSANNHNNVAFHSLMELSVNDYVTLNVSHSYMYVDSGGGGDYNRFSGYLIG
jgi:hypothetical protein